MSHDAWRAHLEALAASCAHEAQLLSAGDYDAVAPVLTPPSGLGPIPAALAPRAGEVLRELEQLRHQLLAAQLEVRRGMPSRRRPLTGRTESATYVDQYG